MEVCVEYYVSGAFDGIENWHTQGKDLEAWLKKLDTKEPCAVM